MQPEKTGRRRFLKESAALAGLAVGTIGSANGQVPPQKTESDSEDIRAYGNHSRFENPRRKPSGMDPEHSGGGTGSGASLTPLQDSIGIITPSSLHYVVSRFRNTPPDIDPQEHRLLIHGLVDRPLIFTLAELKRLPCVSRIYFLECAGNGSPVERRNAKTVQETHGWTSCSEWTGVPLSLLLAEAGVQKGASWIVAESADAGKHAKSIPLEKAMDDVLVAYGQNGEAVRPDQGYPLRLVVPGWEGVNNVKWLRRIKLVDQPYMTHSEATQYPAIRPILEGKALWFNFEMGPKSVITFPSGGHRLPARGFYEITGLVWTGRSAIRSVEVSADGGKTWGHAELQAPVLRMAHTRFRFSWNWDGEEAVLQSRCTDEKGVQPTLTALAKIWGVDSGYFNTTLNRINHFNPIQPWKVTRDGSVLNALF